MAGVKINPMGDAATMIRAGVMNIQHYVHEWAVENGFWDGGVESRNLGEQIALMHSELSELLEANRRDKGADEHCPEFSNVEIEAADLILRLLDTATAYGWRIGDAIIAKHNYNTTRPRKNGKKY